MAGLKDLAHNIRQWNPALHPRDRKGRFTFSVDKMAQGRGDKRLRDKYGPNATIYYERQPLSDPFRLFPQGTLEEGRLAHISNIGKDINRELGVRADFGAELETSIPEITAVGLEDLDDVNAPLPNHIRTVLLPKEGKEQHTVGRYLNKSGAVELNAFNPFWDDPEGEANRLFESGFWSSPNPAGIIHHEGGHHAHFENLKKQGKDILGKIWGGSHVPSGPIYFDIGDRVGKAALKNGKEFVAETFAGMMNGEEYPEEIQALYVHFHGPPHPGLTHYRDYNG